MNFPMPTSVPLEESLSPLHRAACTSTEAVEHLLFVMQKTASFTSQELFVEMVNAKATDDAYNGGYTPLHYACQTGLSGAVRLLLEAGANPNVKKNNGATPLICCISSAGWNPLSRNTVDRRKRLEASAENMTKQKEIIRMLLDHPQFDLQQNDQDGDGKCCPSWMCVGQDFQYKDILSEILDMLLTRGFNANGMIQNRSALHIALLRGHEQCAQLLVRAGADIYTTAPRSLPGSDRDEDETWTALQACRSLYGERASLRMEEAALAASAVAGTKTRLKILRSSSTTNDSVKKLANKSIKTAEQLMEVGRWGAAAAAYEEVLGYGSVVPKLERYKALNNVSACLIQASRSPEAINYSRQLVQEFPDNPMCHITLAITLDQHRMKTGCAPHWDQIAESCAEAETLFDSSRGNEWWLKFASIEQGKQMLKRLLNSIPDKKILDNPACQAAQIALDNFNGRNGDIVRAAHAIDRALSPSLNHPNPLTMRMVRGSIYYQLGTNILEVASHRSQSGRSANIRNALSSLQNLASEDPWAQAKEKLETALAEYDHCLVSNDGRFPNSIPAWNSGLALTSLGHYEEGSALCLEGLGYKLEDQFDSFEKELQKSGSLIDLAPAENTSNKDFMLQLEVAFENARMLIDVSPNEGTKKAANSAYCEAAAAALRADCAATIVDSVLQAHRRLKSAVSTRVVGALLKEALDWDAKCEIPEELQKAQRKVVPALRCDVCGMSGPMQACPCKEAHYCRKECQAKAWKEHKGVCKYHATKKARK